MSKERERQTRKDNKGRIFKKGEGQDKNGRYYYNYTDKDGGRHRIYNADLVALRLEAKAIAKNITDGIDIDAGKRTLNEQFERYMRTKDLKESTKAQYKSIWDKGIYNSIGQKRLTDIRKSDLQMFYKSLKDKGHSDGYIRLYNCLINPALELALDDDIIRKNPNKGCMKDYNGKPKEKKALTEAQQAAFLEYVKHSDTYDYYYPMFQVMFSTALRCGELIGLTWKDIDFEKRTISINHQVNYLDYGDGYKHHCETTKTDAGFRVLPMSDNCYRALKMQREYQFTLGIDRDRETAGLKGFVFTSIRGHAQSPSNMNQLINRVRKSYNEHEAELSHKEKRTPDILPSMSCHTYRHTGCTRLAETHMDMKSLQEYMGHTDLRMTMNVYNHVTGDRMKKELEEAQSKCKVI